MSPIRTAIVVLLLVGATAVTRATRTTVPPPPALAALPFAIDGWRGADSEPLDARTRQELGADVYVTRTYTRRQDLPVGLYVAYYAQQRPNVSIHSPLHCLPGTGWEPLDVATIAIPTAAGPVAARRMIVRKNLDRAVVLYWYVVHGRVLGGELASRFWLLHDGLTLGRSDAALVRLTVPISQSVAAADAESVAFARALLPHVS